MSSLQVCSRARPLVCSSSQQILPLLTPAPGSTRDNFQGRPVATLCYAAYRPRALRSMAEIAADVHARHGLLGLAIVHRLGPVPIGEDSILIAVSAPHRQAAWQAGEECLERVKQRVEIWKEEVFAAQDAVTGETTGEAERVWRANQEQVVERSA